VLIREAAQLEKGSQTPGRGSVGQITDAQVAEILAYVRAITLGSLTGNTVDAFLGRFR